ncbi:uncharacterized protein LOC106166485 isoform X1 [Lingula anatina]|uniref:Uncharacterized protein LOC106166485 isoform X1 n=1 Tax=Lingula anatina TaxID=7574 RepID=A0A2R2MKU4_LINAN|nr:uncharacterized protein LOC106166485 isoform X1 [Lingula anatina]|eukprot:XP_023930677.1 uncharacterized protein LOC106166485 isoform X1 [Lingula anatina]
MPLPADIDQLHPETQALLRAAAEKGGKGCEEGETMEESRAIADAMFEDANQGANYQFKGEKQICTVPSPYCQDGITVWVFKPKPCPPSPTILLYFHGGGFVLGGLRSHDTVVKTLTDTTGCIVVNVNYRLAPEHKFPAGIDDSVTAVKWVMANKEKLGGSGTSKVGVIGDSAGGHLAATIAHEVPGVALQILIVPVTDWRMQTDSYKRYSEGYFMSAKQMVWFASKFFTSDAERTDPRASPLLRSDFQNLPPALYIAASHDVLVDEGKAYAEKLKGAGVHTETLILEGVVHGYILFPHVCKEANDTTLKKIDNFVKTYGR